QDAAYAQKDDAGEEKLNTDDLVIGGEDILPDEIHFRMMMLVGCWQTDAHDGKTSKNVRTKQSAKSFLPLPRPALGLGRFQPLQKLGLIVVHKKPSDHTIMAPAAKLCTGQVPDVVVVVLAGVGIDAVHEAAALAADVRFNRREPDRNHLAGQGVL